MAETDTIFTHDTIHNDIKTALDELEEKITYVPDSECASLSKEDRAFLKMLDELLEIKS